MSNIRAAEWPGIFCMIALPHHTTQLKDHTLMAISSLRLLCMLILSLVRFGICAALLYSGTMWLSSTGSIGDLILNAAALGFVMDVDELFFSTIVPSSVSRLVQVLEIQSNFKASPMPPTYKYGFRSNFRSENKVCEIHERRQWIRIAISSRIQVSMAQHQFSDAISNHV